MVKYNRDGDLFFSCSKDSHPSVWYAHNGERLGSYEGHNGAVWGIDVSCAFLAPAGVPPAAAAPCSWPY